MYYNVNNKPSFYDANLRQNAQGSGSTSHFLLTFCSIQNRPPRASFQQRCALAYLKTAPFPRA